MSTTFSEPVPLSLTVQAQPDNRDHESDSWISPAGPWHRIRLWAQRRAQRKALAYLITDAHADLALGREQALREARKPFWRR